MNFFVAAKWAAFFHMGGYAEYVWPAYGIVALVLVCQVWQAYKGLQKIKNQNKNQYQKIHETAP